MTDIPQPTVNYDDSLKKVFVSYRGQQVEFAADDLMDAQNKANDWLRDHGATVH